MFIRLFKVQPTLQVIFSKFKNMTLDELRVSEGLEKHAAKVMQVLDECVQNIDNVDSTLELMARTAAFHNEQIGFSPNMYLEMEKPFLEAVKITLGDRYTDNMDGIYRITVKYLLDSLMKSHQSVL